MSKESLPAEGAVPTHKLGPRERKQPIASRLTPGVEIYEPGYPLFDRAQAKSNFTYLSRISMSTAQFLEETNASQRNAIIATLDQLILDFARSGRPVLMEGFGVIIMKKTEQQRAYNLGQMAALRTEQVISYDFEKCEHFEVDYTTRFPDLVRTAELTQLCRARLEPEYSLLWSEQLLSRLIRGLFRFVKSQLVQDGQYSGFKNLGRFVALHNRQGDTEADWFAGADILLINNNQSTIATSDAMWFERPVLTDAWELLKAAYGEPLSVIKIDLRKELVTLGYDVSELPTSERNLSSLELAIFQPNSTGSQSRTTTNLIFLSKDLVSLLPQTTRPEIGTEFTWTVEVDQPLNESSWESIINFGRRVFTLGWILLASAKHKQLPIGAGIASSLADTLPSTAARKCHLQAVLTTKFQPFPYEALTNSGKFQYLNLLPITASEYEIAEKISAQYLVEVLERRGVGQVTRLYRNPIKLHLEDAASGLVEQQ